MVAVEVQQHDAVLDRLAVQLFQPSLAAVDQAATHAPLRQRRSADPVGPKAVEREALSSFDAQFGPFVYRHGYGEDIGAHLFQAKSDESFADVFVSLVDARIARHPGAEIGETLDLRPDLIGRNALRR